MTGWIFIKPSHDESIQLQKTPHAKKQSEAPCLGSCGTMSSSCFLFILTLSFAHTSWLSNHYWVIQNRLGTECWRIFYGKVQFLNYSDSTNESIEPNLERTLYTQKKLLYKMNTMVSFQPIMFKTKWVATRVVKKMQFAWSRGSMCQGTVKRPGQSDFGKPDNIALAPYTYIQRKLKRDQASSPLQTKACCLLPNTYIDRQPVGL